MGQREGRGGSAFRGARAPQLPSFPSSTVAAAGGVLPHFLADPRWFVIFVTLLSSL